VRRFVALLAALALVAGGAGAASAKPKPKPKPVPICVSRTLVLSAMPVELGAVLARVDRKFGVQTKTVGGHDYYLATYRGTPLVLTVTGIGPVNAKRAVNAALDAFTCGRRPGIREIVFSGVAGGDYIGDVVVPAKWDFRFPTGLAQFNIDDRMLAVARRAAASKPLLGTTAPAGDPACGCVTSPDAVTTVAVTHKPTIEVGGKGSTTDPFSGRALPCVPGGGDVFGCTPCAAQTNAARDGAAFAPGVVPFADPSFFTGYFASSAPNTGYVAEDEESAAVAEAAFKRGLYRYIAFRGVSDGGGDPLGLPGFPAQFFYYRQLAADNAAIATLAFLALGG
jgi:nucleoside phosphorylase